MVPKVLADLVGFAPPAPVEEPGRSSADGPTGVAVDMEADLQEEDANMGRGVERKVGRLGGEPIKP